VRQQRVSQDARDAGYTLLELLVVMGIIAILTAAATPQLMGYFGKAKVQSVQLQIENINTALEMYFMENGNLSERERRAERPWSRRRPMRRAGTDRI